MTFIVSPTPVVVDASLAVDGVRGDAVVEDYWQRWAAEGRMLLAPAIVWPEIGNALLGRGKGDAGAVVAGLALVRAAGLETADRGPDGVCHAAALAARHGLTMYDATYLWLAIDVDGELATRDRALIRAAEAEGVPLALEP